MKKEGHLMFLKDIIVKKTVDIVFGLFGLILLFLFLMSVSETCRLNIDEVISYHKDSFLIHVLFWAGVCLVAVKLRERLHIRVRTFVLYGFFFLCMAGFILSTQLYPKADQLQIMAICPHIVEKNYQDFYPGGYLYSQPHQIFLTYVCTVLYVLFGKSYVFVFQFLNCFAVLGIYFLLGKWYRRFETQGSVNVFFVISFLFFPLVFYVTFVYGTILGLFCSLAALYFFVRYLEDLRACHMVFCTFFIVLAQLLKSNYLIFFVGIVVVLCLEFFREKNFRHLFFCAMLIVSLLFCNRMVEKFTEDMTNIQSNGGVPKILFVAMGLTESEKGPGWWNGYHDNVYLRNGFDVEVSKEIGKKKIEGIFHKMRKNPWDGASFFVRKIASEWSEPTYESIWIQQSRESGTDMPILIDRLIHNGGRLAEFYTFYCNLYQSFLYLGALLFVWVRWKKISVDELLIPIIFMGGFLFHTFWEAKGQYTLPYCICLLPYCISGYRGMLMRFYE